jgi:SOS-response transcriptional repressor LexA
MNPIDQVEYKDPRLSDAENNVLHWLKSYIASNGYSPTLKELAELCERSKGTIQGQVDMLKQKGFVTFEKGLSRTLRPTTPAGV